MMMHSQIVLHNFSIFLKWNFWTQHRFNLNCDPFELIQIYKNEHSNIFLAELKLFWWLLGIINDDDSRSQYAFLQVGGFRKCIAQVRKFFPDGTVKKTFDILGWWKDFIDVGDENSTFSRRKSLKHNGWKCWKVDFIEENLKKSLKTSVTTLG